jgi:hypothetical protein
MAKVNLTEFLVVRGDFTIPNTRKSEIELRWASDRQEQRFYLIEATDHEDYPMDSSAILLGELPTQDQNPTTVQALEQWFAARDAVHPLANRLPSTVGVTERALAAGVDPYDVARLCARYGCFVGVARAIAKVLNTGPEGEELAKLKHVALAATSAEALCLPGFAPYGYSDFGKKAQAMFGEPLPSLLSKLSYHDGGEHEAVCKGYNQQVVAYMRAASSVVARVFDAPPAFLRTQIYPKLTARTVVLSAEQIEQRMHNKGPEIEGLSASNIHGLEYQPFARIAPLVAEVFSGGSEELTESRFVSGLRALATSDHDVVDELKVVVEREAAEEARNRARLEQERREREVAAAAALASKRRKIVAAVFVAAIIMYALTQVPRRSYAETPARTTTREPLTPKVYGNDAGQIVTVQPDGSVKTQTIEEALNEVEAFIRTSSGSLPSSRRDE